MLHRPLRTVLQEHALRFVGTALFPRVAYWLRWPTRLGARGLLVYIAANTALIATVRLWLIPQLAQGAERQRRASDDLRERLGRDPTPEELIEHLYGGD